jgi:hypothetical protein
MGLLLTNIATLATHGHPVLQKASKALLCASMSREGALQALESASHPCDGVEGPEDEPEELAPPPPATINAHPVQPGAADPGPPAPLPPPRPKPRLVLGRASFKTLVGVFDLLVGGELPGKRPYMSCPRALECIAPARADQAG